MWENLTPAASFANYVFGSVSGLVIVIASIWWLWRHSDADAFPRWFMAALGTIGAGWFLHQGYWLAWRGFDIAGYSEISRWYVDNAYLVTPSYLVIGLGALKCLAIVSIKTGKVPLYYLLSAAALWIAGFGVGLVIS